MFRGIAKKALLKAISMKKVKSVLAATIGLLAIFSLSKGYAQSLGPNGRYYKVVQEGNLLWEDARLKAAQSTFNNVHGHLATITSAEENDFIDSLRRALAPTLSVWIGGYQMDAPSPGGDWLWINGEGRIPSQNGGATYVNWAAGEPNATSVSNTVQRIAIGVSGSGWTTEADDRHVQGYVIEYPGGGSPTKVSVIALDPIAVEDASATTNLNIATFSFHREGDLSQDLPVFYSVSGTALNGGDYDEISLSIVIPAGESSASLKIIPRIDNLGIVEDVETVGIRIQQSLILTPNATYTIDDAQREAAAVIFEFRAPESALELAVPAGGMKFKYGEPVVLLAALSASNQPPAVDFYAAESLGGTSNKVGSATLHNGFNEVGFYRFVWTNPTPGSNYITAVFADDARTLSSRPVLIAVANLTTTPVVKLRAVPIEPGWGGDYASAQFEVSRTGPTDENLQVHLAISGNATAGSDYVSLPTYVTIGSNRTTARITLSTIDDNTPEGDEHVALTLVDSGNPVSYTVDQTTRQATVSIVDADSGVKYLNIDFTASNGNIKAGPAAVGNSATDYWNFYNKDTGAINGEPNGPRWSDKTPSGTQLAMTSGLGAWGTGSSDPMLHTYLYTFGAGRITASLTAFPASTVDVYVYAHGMPGSENGVITLAVNGVSQGRKSTTTISGWDTPGWTEGNEYVVFRNVIVPDNATVEIHSDPGISGQAVINGAQVVASFGLTAPKITKQPSSATLFAGDNVVLAVEATGGSLAYQWFLNDVLLEGKTAATLEIQNFAAANVGSYSVRVTNGGGAVSSSSAKLALAARLSGKLMDIDYTAHLNPAFTVKTGPAAVGVAANDFWNVYSRDTSSLWDWRPGGQVNALKWTDGTSTAASLIVTNAAGAWLTTSDDPMLKSYLYPLSRSGNITSTLHGLPPQSYDISVYAHGQPDSESARVALKVNGVSIETLSTSSQPGWDGAAWVNGNQFVLFRGVEVADGTTVEIISQPGASDIAVINGIQLAANPSALRIVSQPVSQTVPAGQSVSFSVEAEGSGTLTYQWSKNGVEISGATGPAFTIAAVSSADAGNYAVRVRNGAAVAVSQVAALVVTPGGATQRKLLNIDFTSYNGNIKTGPAAVGETATDYWNFWNNEAGVINGEPDGPRWSDKTPSGTKLTVTRAGGWGTGSSDPMLHTYIYGSSPLTATLTNFPASTVDLYVYAHGVPGGENGVITLVVNGQSKGQKSTTTINNWDTPGWTEGNEYVVFRNIAVPAGSKVDIHADPGVAGVAVLNGAQFVTTFPGEPVNPAPVITKQPGSGTAFLGDTVVIGVEAIGSDLTYQWRLNDVPLDGKTSATLEIPNFGASNVGIYTVRVKNNDGEVISKRADWALAARASAPLIDINYTAHLNPAFSVKSGPAAIGVNTNDYWNVYSRDTTSMYDWRAGGVVSGLKLTDGSATSASLIVTNAAGAWTTPSQDAMMKSYLYPLGRSGDILSTFSNLPPARYDIYVYAHGNSDSENALVRLRVNGVTVDVRNTASQPGWDAPAWVEGNQYVLFRSIEVPQGTVIDLISARGEADIAVINGIQLVAHPSILSIVAHPVSQVVTSGQPVSLSVQAEGSGTLTYQWFRNDALLNDATNSSLSISAASGADVGTYAVRVSNGTALAVSKPATITIEGGGAIALPVIAQQPIGRTLFAGDSIALSVGAEGSGLTYQWKKDGAVLEGKTAASLEIASASAADVGSYTVTVSNAAGAVTSRRANVSLATRVAGQLMDINYTAHLNAAFEVKTGPAAVGVATNDFWNVYSRDVSDDWDWRSSGTVAGLKWTDGTVTPASLTVTNAMGAWYTFSDDAMLESYLYPISRSGALGSLIENLPPQRYDIYVYAHGQPTNENASIEIKVGGVSVGTRSTSAAPGWDSAAWIDGNQFVTFSGVEIPAGASLEIISRADRADIALINGIQLAAQPSVLRIVTQPLSRTNTLGTRAAFSVQAEGQGTLTYQWLRNGAEISGATSAEFAIAAVELTDAGGYSVRVRNDVATVVSQIATLTVIAEGGSSGGSERNLLNIDYGTTADYGRKVGPAAVGFTTNDHWNVYSRDSQSLVSAPQGMKWSDGTLAAAQMTVQNADGAWGSNAEDIMLHTYLYPISRSGDVASTFTAIPAGLYDVFVYAHGQPADENGVIEVLVNGVSHGIKATSSSADWDSPGWTEGKEYVLFSSVDVPTNAVVRINAKPGVSGLSVINGVQFLSAPLTPTAPSILTQPQGRVAFAGQTINLNVTAEGSRPLTYQWRVNGTNLLASPRIIGVDSPYLTVSNALPLDAGDYSVVVQNSLGEVTSSNAVVTVTADTEPPQILITSPTAGAHDTAAFSLQGSVSDNNAIASVKWFRNGVTMGSLALVDGKFNVGGLRLDPGDNVIRVIAADVAGNESSAEVAATFTVPRALVLGTVVPQQDGSRFVIPISIVSTGGVSGAEFALTFDTNYLADAQFEWSESLVSGLASVNLETPKRFRASFALPGVTLAPGSNRIAVVSFRARSVPTTLQTPLGLELIGIFNENGDPYVSGNSANSIALTITKRKITGDNNANDRLDVGDASVMLRMVSRIDPVRLWDRTLNDLNANRDLDPGDVIKVLRTVVGLDPQPQPPVAPLLPGKKVQIAADDGGGSGVTMTMDTTIHPVLTPVNPELPGVLVADKPTAAPGEKVTVEVRLTPEVNGNKPVSGASFKLQYPVTALKLENATAHALGSMVPGGAVAIWNVSPSQNNYATQDGSVSFAVSTAAAWPNNTGVLARFTFTVQPGATTLYGWPVLLENLEVSRDGFTTELLGRGSWTFTGHAATQAALNPNITFDVDGKPTFTLQGDAGAWFKVEASSDLKTWSPVHISYAADGTITVKDELAAGVTVRFYRAIQLPN